MEAQEARSCTAAEARGFWIRQEREQGRLQPRQLERQPPLPGGACGAGKLPQGAEVRVGRASSDGPLASLCTHTSEGAELAALTAVPRTARRAVLGASDAGLDGQRERMEHGASDGLDVRDAEEQRDVDAGHSANERAKNASDGGLGCGARWSSAKLMGRARARSAEPVKQVWTG